jgi:1-aminocyclopropane-1-carboxylate deaminase/D-cysteine desulfhydrase-like pyridoxal-dependent ACC family enzyme
VLPLIERFPALARVPRVSIVVGPTPVVHLEAIAEHLWIKRDDLCAAPIGGNKARALEFLLGGLRAGERVVTVGSAGSTHALSVATFGRQLGLDVRVARWTQEMNDAATSVSAQTRLLASSSPIFPFVAGAFVWAWVQRLRGARWIPAGGSSPLGVLGHLNAGLELVAQIDAGSLPMPRRVIVPLGTGGTAAGLALAFAIAGCDVEVAGVRVVPRVVANEAHVRRLADRTARLVEHITGSPVARPGASAISVVHDEYGGAYGRETESGRKAAERLRAAYGIALDATYSAKAFARALALANDGPSLFWLTFDPRTLDRRTP